MTKIPNPINYYGQTKYEGELEVQKLLTKYFIIRIFGVFRSNGNNFAKTILKLGRECDELSIITDQVASPTYTYDLALLLVDMIQTEKYGIYNVTNEGYCSWYEFACEIFKQTGMDIMVTPIKTEDYPTKVKRPKNSRLSKSLIRSSCFELLPHWRKALGNYLRNEDI